MRNGIAESALFATITTDASCGAVNGVHDSFTPLGGMVPLVNIMLGEVVFGGVGAGMYGILIFVVLSVFIAGLMVGRTPEYLGKKIESYDVKTVDALRAHLPAHHPFAHRVFRPLANVRTVLHQQSRTARFHPKSSTPSLREQATTAPHLQVWRPTGGTTSRWAGTCSSGGSS